MLITLRKTTRVIIHRLASVIALLTFLPTVAFARAAARRDIEEYFVWKQGSCNIFARAVQSRLFYWAAVALKTRAHARGGTVNKG